MGISKYSVDKKERKSKIITDGVYIFSKNYFGVSIWPFYVHETWFCFLFRCSGIEGFKSFLFILPLRKIKQSN